MSYITIPQYRREEEGLERRTRRAELESEDRAERLERLNWKLEHELLLRRQVAREDGDRRLQIYLEHEIAEARINRYTKRKYEEHLLNSPLKPPPPYLVPEKPKLTTRKAGNSDLIKAAKLGNVDEVRELLGNDGIDINTQDEDGNTPLHLAIQDKHQEVIKVLLKNQKANVGCFNKAGYAPIHSAVYSNDVEIVDVLLKHEADVDRRDKRNKMAPIILASRKGYKKIVETLIDKSATIEAEDIDGYTALHVSSLEGHDEVVRLLLEEGAKPDAKTNTRSTALHLAASWNKVKVVQILLEKLSQSPQMLNTINEVDASEHTAWYFALKSKNQDLVKEFLKHKNELNLRNHAFKDIECVVHEPTLQIRKEENENSWGMLDWAVYYGDSELVFSLLKGSNNNYKKECAAKIASKMLENVGNITENSTGKKAKNAKFLIEKYDDEYSDILDIIRYRDIPYNPTLVEIDNLGTEFVTPKVGTPKDELQKTMRTFYAGITDIYESGESFVILRRARNVYKVIYRDGPEPIMCAARQQSSTLYKPEVLKLRWIHLPANNMKWMEDLVLRICVDEDDIKTGGVSLESETASAIPGETDQIQNERGKLEKITEKSKKNYYHLADFFKRSWHQLPSGKSTAHFMKPDCVFLSQLSSPESVKKSVKPATEEGGKPTSEEGGKPATKEGEKSEEQVFKPLALYIPYLTFSTLTSRAESKETNTANKRWKSSHENSGKQDAHPVKESSPDGKSVEHDGANTSRRRLANKLASARFNESIPAGTSQNPNTQTVPHNPQSNEEVSHKIRHKAPDATDGTLDKHKDLKLPSESDRYRNLLNLYKEELSCKIHGSRTLDESFYHSVSDEDPEAIKDMDCRNADQVVTKRVQDLTLGDSKSRDILRVGQLWIWVINENTIISSSTHCVLNDENDPVLKGIWDYLEEEVIKGRAQVPSSPLEMAKVMTDFCIKFFDDPNCSIPVGLRKETIFQIFENSINKTAREEAELFSQFTAKITKYLKSQTEISEMEKGREGSQSNDMKEDRLAAIRSIGKAANVLKTVKDIRDELNMLRAILSHQLTVWKDLHGISSTNGNVRGPTYYLGCINEMDSQAERVQSAVGSVLDLEQNEAAIEEAMASTEQTKESIKQTNEAITQTAQTVKQGKILMAFTVITMIFLPMSFITSLLALDIDGFPQSTEGMKIQGVSWKRSVYGYIIGPAFIFVLLVGLIISQLELLTKNIVGPLLRLSKDIQGLAVERETGRNKSEPPGSPTSGNSNSVSLNATLNNSHPAITQRYQGTGGVTAASEQRPITLNSSFHYGSRNRLGDEEDCREAARGS